MHKSGTYHNPIFFCRNNPYGTNELENEPWICGSVVLYDRKFKYQKPIFSAQVLFRYPIVGRVLFRQPLDEPWTDTSIFVDYIVHADGSNLNNSAAHRWAIHTSPPGKDFYDWQNRCLSAGDIYNSYKVFMKFLSVKNFPQKYFAL